MPTKKFWMLSADGSSDRSPRRRFEVIDEARDEGKRLCMKEMNRVYLMESTEAYVPDYAALPIKTQPAEHTTADLKELGAGVNSDLVTGRSLAERVL